MRCQGRDENCRLRGREAYSPQFRLLQRASHHSEIGMARTTLNINGQRLTVDIAPDTPLLWIIRDNAGLTGTKFGCGIGQCGACTVHVAGVATKSCQVRAADVGGTSVTTIEALSTD